MFFFSLLPSAPRGLVRRLGHSSLFMFFPGFSKKLEFFLACEIPKNGKIVDFYGISVFLMEKSDDDELV